MLHLLKQWTISTIGMSSGRVPSILNASTKDCNFITVVRIYSFNILVNTNVLKRSFDETVQSCVSLMQLVFNSQGDDQWYWSFDYIQCTFNEPKNR